MTPDATLPTTQLKITLPFPPTTNNAYRRAGRRRVKTKAARDYQRNVQETLWTEPLAHHFRRTIQRHRNPRLAVDITLHPPDNRRRDLANFEKLAVDAVFTWLGPNVDDSLIDELCLRRGTVNKPGKIHFRITALPK